MKNIFTLILMLFPSFIFSQESFENEIVDRLCGLRVKEKPYYNLGHYSIFTNKVQWDFTPKNIKLLKKKYKVRKIKNEISTNAISQRNKILTKKASIKNGNYEITTLYFVETGESQIDIIGFLSINTRDTTEEHNFVNLYIENKIPESIFMEYPVAKIDFAGREIVLGNSCNWINVNSIQCPSFGQMNWSLHQNLESAQKETEFNMKSLKGKT